MADPNPYQMTLSFSVMKHLGLGLYSNVPAVLSEVVANAWDADAQKVVIDIDVSGKITITDDGHGMSVDDANNKYLYVGYERRRQESGRTDLGRPVMGRKGIGKLSLFSIAKTIEIHSAKDGEFHGFILNTDDIEEMIKHGEEKQYYPERVPTDGIELRMGTRIILTNVKRRLHRSNIALKRRLARRFSIIGPDHDFRVVLNGQEISPVDRGYHDKVQYIWTFDRRGEMIQNSARNRDDTEQRSPDLSVDDQSYKIGGWIGTARKAGDLKDPETGENLNRIAILVRGKLALDDILDEFADDGVYSKYIFGEIHADFLDQDDGEDIATTSRQKIIEDDPRYRALHAKIQNEVKHIGNRWTGLRNEEGQKVAELIPQIKTWIAGLDESHREDARKLLGRINRLPIDDDTEKRQIFIGAIFTFERLRFRRLTRRIDQISDDNLAVLGQIFTQLDDLEESAYYQTTHNRLDVITKLADLVDENKKERVIQEHLFDHLWLLDPSWERATSTERMERRIASALTEVSKNFTPEEIGYRVDIRYKTTAGKHVIIELKRANRTFRTEDLISQISKYHGAISKVLSETGHENEQVDFVCVVGRALRDWSDPGGRERSDKTFAAQNARVVMYDRLIDSAQAAYRDYLGKKDKAGRIYRLIIGISDEDASALGPSS